MTYPGQKGNQLDYANPYERKIKHQCGNHRSIPVSKTIRDITSVAEF